MAAFQPPILAAAERADLTTPPPCGRGCSMS